jgi:aspartyl-tRNA(Asn)/glutamyl-tRNA(Gln) amidotransferase subunit C
MSKLTREDIFKLARLARLQLSDAEAEQFSKEMSAILEYVEQLQTVDTTGLPPTSQVTGLKNVTRKDEIKDYGVSREDLLKNAPAIEDGHFKVRRMIG